MTTTAAFFILFLLTGEATLTPVGQYESKEACAVIETVMNAALGERSVEGAKFKCLDAQSLLDMLQKNGVEVN